MESTFDGINWKDYLVIAAYFVFVLIVGLIVSTHRQNPARFYLFSSRKEATEILNKVSSRSFQSQLKSNPPFPFR